MESFGRYLVQQRELRGLGREDVARQTRLSPPAIDALENDRFDELPARVFVVGYLRAYAQCVGLGPDELIARYDEWRVRMGLDVPEEPEPPRPARTAAPRWPWIVGGAVVLLTLLAWWIA
jgi:cytoskeletal protein RodZ